MAQSWELRQQVAAIRASGKKTIALLGSSELKAYYLASSAEAVWYSPNDVFAPMGLRSTFLSIREAMAKLGVEAQFLRIGDYKSAPEMFIVDEPTEPNVEQRNAYLDAIWKRVLTDIGKSRNMDSDKVEKLITSTHLPDEAVARKLVDRIVYPDEVETFLRKEHQASLERGYPEREHIDDQWRGGPQIAVVAVDGNIVRGRSDNSPLFGDPTAGARSLTATFEQLRKNPQVRAVVVRIDSPGGSAVGSDLIYHAMRRLAVSKPVIASMGNLAASGGYYVAAGADEILATPTTLTGSIGIFAGKVNIQQLSSRVGLSTQRLERGSPTTYSDVFVPWTKDEMDVIGTSLQYMYRLFLTQVAATRPLTAEEVDKVARGRVWVGTDAREAKLVDENGGLVDAIHRAEELAGLPRGKAQYRQYTPSSRMGIAVDLQTRAAKLLGIKRPEDTIRAMLERDTMFTRYLRETSFAWRLPLLYDNGEPLMLLPTSTEETR